MKREERKSGQMTMMMRCVFLHNTRLLDKSAYKRCLASSLSARYAIKKGSPFLIAASYRGQTEKEFAVGSKKKKDFYSPLLTLHNKQQAEEEDQRDCLIRDQNSLHTHTHTPHMQSGSKMISDNKDIDM